MSCTLLIQHIEHFFFDDPLREFGYCQNKGEGIGSFAMMGARVAKAKIVAALDKEEGLAKVAQIIAAVAIGIFTLPATLIGATIYGISSLLPHSFNPVDDTVFPRTSPYIVDQVYSLTDQFDRIAKASGLSYWATAGTLLGAQRHKGMIPWDDDGDFCIRQSDLPTLLKMKPTLAAVGLVLEEGPLGLYKVRYTTEKRKELFDADEEAALDIMPNIQDKSGSWIPADRLYRDLYPKEIFLDEEINTLNEVPFGPNGLKVPIAKNPDRFLKSVYGDDCLEYGVRTHSHKGFFGFKLGNLEFNPVLTKQKVKIVGDFAVGNIWK